MNKAAAAPQAKIANFLPHTQGNLQRKCACGNHTTAGEECAECAKKKGMLQRKLSIGASNDPLELEADRVAEQVMAAPARSKVSGASPQIQRFTGQSSGQMDAASNSVDQVLARTGKPLAPALQQDMEQRFGHDFSRVRVHSDGVAEQSARDVNAHAYTVGHHVVFGAGQFAPETHTGRRLIAHELTHVVQQSGVDPIRVGQCNEKLGLPGSHLNASEYVHVTQLSTGNFSRARRLQRQVKPAGGLSDQQLEQIALQLYEALGGPPFISNRPEVLSILSRLTQAQMDAIARVYKSKYGSELIDDLKTNFSGSEMKQLAILPKGKIEHVGVIKSSGKYSVPHGKVEVRTGEEIELRQGTKIPNVIALEYKGMFSQNSKWLQFVWFEEFGSTSDNQVLITAGQSFPVGCGSQSFSSKSAPGWGVDAGCDDPFYEAGGAHIRSSSSITMFDDPGGLEENSIPRNLADRWFAGNPISSVTWTAHFETYLIQNDNAIYLVSWQASAAFTQVGGKTVVGAIGYTVGSSGPQHGLPPDRKALLDRRYPRFKHVK